MFKIPVSESVSSDCKLIQAEQMRTKNADSVNKSALHLLLKQGTLLDLMLLCLMSSFWRKSPFLSVELEVSALTVTKEM